MCTYVMLSGVRAFTRMLMGGATALRVRIDLGDPVIKQCFVYTQSQCNNNSFIRNRTLLYNKVSHALTSQ